MESLKSSHISTDFILKNHFTEKNKIKYSQLNQDSKKTLIKIPIKHSNKQTEKKRKKYKRKVSKKSVLCFFSVLNFFIFRSRNFREVLEKRVRLNDRLA
ncbi:Uncharacterized protein TCM_012275 [Theobroma cacao]|uniref:Uncharacterized protein n=1 Tax=Theobroma cacao TaxID=3641 RepID=A0A061G1P1_THECC|nr:Uncharacterized protein TCM_012275 [Theobroma cacao]